MTVDIELLALAHDYFFIYLSHVVIPALALRDVILTQPEHVIHLLCDPVSRSVMRSYANNADHLLKNNVCILLQLDRSKAVIAKSPVPVPCAFILLCLVIRDVMRVQQFCECKVNLLVDTTIAHKILCIKIEHAVCMQLPYQSTKCRQNEENGCTIGYILCRSDSQLSGRNYVKYNETFNGGS
jgi:hypothetical protein